MNHFIWSLEIKSLIDNYWLRHSKQILMLHCSGNLHKSMQLEIWHYSSIPKHKSRVRERLWSDTSARGLVTLLGWWWLDINDLHFGVHSNASFYMQNIGFTLNQECSTHLQLIFHAFLIVFTIRSITFEFCN